MRTCDRCGQPIRPSEGYHTVIPDSMSGARPTTHIHVRWCKPPTTQTRIPR